MAEEAEGGVGDGRAVARESPRSAAGPAEEDGGAGRGPVLTLLVR